MKTTKANWIILIVICVVATFTSCRIHDDDIVTITEEPEIDTKTAIDNYEYDITLLVYINEDGNNWEARRLYIDLDKDGMNLDKDALFSIYSSNGYTESIYPVDVTKDFLVLNCKSSCDPQTKYIVDNKDNDLWCRYDLLEYDQITDKATIYSSDKKIGQINDLIYENTKLVPVAFFVKDNRLEMLCNRAGEDMPSIWDDPLISVSAIIDGGECVERKMQSYRNMFSEDISVIQIPFYNGTDNVIGVNETGKFYWNEGRSVIEIDPETGEYKTILTEQMIASDMPDINTEREGYGFFQRVGWQNNLFILTFQDFNNQEGTYLAIYDEDCHFVGRVLTSNGSIILSDKNNVELDRINNTSLQPFIYIPHS